ncbi:MAG: phosphoribosylformylglycinamidine synthase, partial [Candidatus Marinimicrobia bacterium]|nr:phosphoribosylformylglycinamidine synthase [Candidatus Neomarinimicrobiota bacterium]
QALPLYRALAAATAAGLLRSAHTPTLGGLAAAAALCALAGNRGAELELAAAPGADKLPATAAGDDALLFSESNSRFLVTCAPDRAAELEAHFANLPCARLGTVAAAPTLTLRRGARALVHTPLEPLRKAFKKTLAGI